MADGIAAVGADTPAGARLAETQEFFAFIQQEMPALVERWQESDHAGDEAMSYVVRFAELGRGDIAVAGGKGANLGELTRAGLPVPPGFVLTTAAYRTFVEGVQEKVLAFASASDAAGIRALLTAPPIPDEMAREVTEAWSALGEVPVAVRSSATAEDLEGASFAGQQDTYLNVRGAAALLDAVRECWASLWTERAMAYRARQGIDPAEVALAVVVQRMVEADAAGVMFTANPSTGRRDEVVRRPRGGSASPSWAARSPPTTSSSRRRTCAVAARTTADKAVMTVYAGMPRRRSRCPPSVVDAPVLDDKAAAELAELGMRIEQHFRRAAGRRVGAGWRRVLRGAGPADHRAARARGGAAHRMARAGPKGVLLQGEHRRAAARPAVAAVRGDGRRVGHPVAAGADARLPGGRGRGVATSACPP